LGGASISDAPPFFVVNLAGALKMPPSPRRKAFLSVVILLIGSVLDDRALAQIFPDPKMTRVFENQLHDWSTSGRRVFVTDCNLGKADKALLLFPIGNADGMLVLTARGDVYNGAGAKVESNGITLIDAGGGDWSHRRLLDIAGQLARIRFAMMQPDDVIPLLRAESANICREPTPTH
jgi:hypothetical protein